MNVFLMLWFEPQVCLELEVFLLCIWNDGCFCFRLVMFRGLLVLRSDNFWRLTSRSMN